MGYTTEIVNLSLHDGVFAETWKTAIVRPLLKIAGMDLTASNYRPVRKLPFTSKVVEKCMLTRLTAHCDKNHLVPDYQSAYQKNWTALVKLLDDILWSMEKQDITAVIAIDLSAVFDTVDHGILLDKQFGVRETALKWVDSYLRPRNFKVCVGKEYSSVRPLEFSVPQGSGAGPKFYSGYASTMKDVVLIDTDIHG